MKNMYIKIIEVEQPIGKFYIGKIDGNTLYNMAKADIRQIKNGKDYLGIQRSLDKSRVKLIKEYIDTVHSSFPNSIILNINKDYIINIEKDRLNIKITEETFSIIDGQHRLAGFENRDRRTFELVVAIFIDLNIEEQAILFSTINSEQKKVDPSFKYDLESYSSIKTPRKIVRDISMAFNTDDDSPWNRKIKMTGKKDLLNKDPIITLKAFAEPIINFIYNDKRDMYKLRDELYEYKYEHNLDDNFDIKNSLKLSNYDYDTYQYIFWNFYCNDREDIIYKILMNYFKALNFILHDDWCNNKSILNKTTGYNAIMRIFFDIYHEAYNKKDFSYDFFMKKLSPLKCMNGYITSDNFGGSGEISTVKLYKEMKKIIK